MDPVNRVLGVKEKTQEWKDRTSKVWNGKEYQYLSQQSIDEKIVSKEKIANLLK